MRLKDVAYLKGEMNPAVQIGWLIVEEELGARVGACRRNQQEPRALN